MKISLPRQPDLFGVPEITEKLRKETKVEHLYFVKDNLAFVWFKGYKDYVSPPKEQMLRMQNALVLHNHIQGTSFSFEDIQSIVQHNAQELRIISQARTYIVKRPVEGWGFTFDNQEDYSQFQEAFTEANTYMDKLIEAKILLQSEKKDFTNHFTWRIFFSKFGISYNYYGL